LQVKIFITLKNGVVDPQGVTIKGALESLGYQGIANIRLGKYIQMELNSKSREEAEKDVEEMCDKLLANPVIENYKYEISESQERIKPLQNSVYNSQFTKYDSPDKG